MVAEKSSFKTHINMIRAYPNQTSIYPGDTLKLHVSTDQAFFRVEIYRQGENLDLIDSSAWFKGVNLPQGSADTDWGWLGYDIMTGATWTSGVYIAMFIEGDSNKRVISRPDKTTADGRSAKALFVIKNPNPGTQACILYKVPLFTYHAYKAFNETDSGGSLYTGASKVSFLRPGGGTGGTPWDYLYGIVDEYDLSSPRQTFAHWDAPFISWLEKNKYNVDYCTDLDIHINDGNFMSAYRLIISAGHDEYWSESMRNNIQDFIYNNGNVAFFSGNTCWWRVHMEDANTAMSCDKGSFPGDQWYNFNPENKLIGVSYRNGSGWWSGFRENVGYEVQHSSHWVFDGTGLSDGNIFGANENLVGYECDGCLYHDSGGYKVPLTTDGTPANFFILGIGKLSANWQDNKSGNLAATMGLYTNHGIVFNAATTDWARVLHEGNNRVVEKITHNVLKHLRSKTLRILGLSSGACGARPVEGKKFTFHLDTSKLINKSSLHYTWTVNGKRIKGNNKPTLEVTMPSPAGPVTISVFVADGTDCPGFASLTFIPLTQQEAAFMEFFCKLRMLVQRLSVLVVGIGEGKGPFVDPLYDPPKGEIMRNTNYKKAKKVLQESKSIFKNLEGSLKNLK